MALEETTPTISQQSERAKASFEAKGMGVGKSKKVELLESSKNAKLDDTTSAEEELAHGASLAFFNALIRLSLWGAWLSSNEKNDGKTTLQGLLTTQSGSTKEVGPNKESGPR
jgi:hypothetical protein